jgi:hypothetical protein
MTEKAVGVALDDELLEAYALMSYGYGTYDAGYWFIGVEQGSDGTPDEIRRRLASWCDRGSKELDDLVEYCQATRITKWFDGPTPPLQPTWKQLIRIMLTAEGRDDGTEQVRRYQAKQLGRRDGETCLLELLPLPARKTDRRFWPYGSWSRLPHLATRERYERHYPGLRISRIRARIREHAPKAVVFYGGGSLYRSWWDEIAEVPFRRTDPIGAWIGTNGHTVFAITKHPTRQEAGLGNDYFRRIGHEIRAARFQAGPRPQG